MIIAGLVSIGGMNASSDKYIRALALEYNKPDAEKRGICGVSHDKGQNLFIGQLPDGWQASNHVLLEKIINEDSSDNLQQLEFQIGNVLVSDADTLLVANRELCQELFARPLYRLWCFNYREEKAAETDYKRIFGIDAKLDGRKSLETLEAQVRAEIKGLVVHVSQSV